MCIRWIRIRIRIQNTVFFHINQSKISPGWLFFWMVIIQSIHYNKATKLIGDQIPGTGKLVDASKYLLSLKLFFQLLLIIRQL
jgi:hypothetical protein